VILIKKEFGGLLGGFLMLKPPKTMYITTHACRICVCTIQPLVGLVGLEAALLVVI